ncbi:di-trans,poly-cis-decaprenylcistransferase [Candidatus Woesearchaeota archaeon CG10_big_fil_rev_8_21_14_0_10_32_9]|nr:MAG: di-trans,poly-cis-decaprenylcistransferase [Candidatus Woesearchaeota archaeon CG10_big_fil_rev_8_21_14_0_10_32_9]
MSDDLLDIVKKIPKDKLPSHVAIVLDGNRRFAKRLNLDPWKGHEWGEKKVQKVLDWSKELGIKELTFYAFSLQNFDRPKQEFDYILKLFLTAAEKLFDDERLEKYNLKIRFIGRINLFPEKIQKLMNRIMEKTKNNSDYIVNFAMAYGGREEILDAVKKIIPEIKEGTINSDNLSEEMFSKFLYLADEPDLIIRTGGEKRTSNFLLWQSFYSEWIFLDKFWPEFEREDFLKCIIDYTKRERRIGK